MKYLKSTLESFKENELLSTHKLKIKGGIPLDWIEGGGVDEDVEYDENGNPIGNADGPGPRGGGGSSSATSNSSLGNSNTGNLPPIGGL